MGHSDEIHTPQGALAVLGAQLRQFRVSSLKVTQEQFAQTLDVSVTTVKRMESGQPGVAIGVWLKTWALMEVLPDIVKQAEPNEAMFSQMLQEHFPEYGDVPGAKDGAPALGAGQSGGVGEVDLDDPDVLDLSGDALEL